MLAVTLEPKVLQDPAALEEIKATGAAADKGGKGATGGKGGTGAKGNKGSKSPDVKGQVGFRKCVGEANGTGATTAGSKGFSSTSKVSTGRYKYNFSALGNANSIFGIVSNQNRVSLLQSQATNNVYVRIRDRQSNGLTDQKNECVIIW